MTEIGDGPKSEFSKVRLSLNRLNYKSQKLLEEAGLKIDSDARAAKELLTDVGSHLGFLINPDNLPKVLQINTGSREFVSIRRLEGKEIENRFINLVEPDNKDPFKTILNATISPDSIAEGQILVFDTPITFDYKCKNPEVEQQILDILGDRIGDFGNFLWIAMMSDHPGLYKDEDWKPARMDIVTVTKKGGKLFCGSVYENKDPDSKPETISFHKLEPNKNGETDLFISGYFQSATDRDANIGFLRKFGRIYLLTEGSSEKDRAKKPLSELEPVFTTQTTN